MINSLETPTDVHLLRATPPNIAHHGSYPPRPPAVCPPRTARMSASVVLLYTAVRIYSKSNVRVSLVFRVSAIKQIHAEKILDFMHHDFSGLF